MTPSAGSRPAEEPRRAPSDPADGAPTPAHASPDRPPPAEEAQGAARSSSPGGGFLLTVLFDVGLPIGLYYTLRGAGFSEVSSLLLSGSAPAVHTLHGFVRKREINAIGVFTLSVLAVSALATLLTANPRAALARNGAFTALAAVWLLLTLFTKRPVTYQAAKAMLPRRSAALEHLLATDPPFVRVWRGLTVLWGCGLLVDAALRVVMAYTLPVDTVPVLDGVLYAVTWLALQVVTQIALHRSGTLRKIFADDPSPAAQARQQGR
ncbi:VC0807 family protein [Streptomyces sp. TRM68367]|uniref:VC0807 family protein n=1 Tax=Streptomyces sp. TRM68367 TaxID=2758415 RepID=UPI0021D0EA2A|nr:VC0807 family protein [Streptomyces sp. TRM68367]